MKAGASLGNGAEENQGVSDLAVRPLASDGIGPSRYRTVRFAYPKHPVMYWLPPSLGKILGDLTCPQCCGQVSVRRYSTIGSPQPNLPVM